MSELVLFQLAGSSWHRSQGQEQEWEILGPGLKSAVTIAAEQAADILDITVPPATHTQELHGAYVFQEAFIAGLAGLRTTCYLRKH